MSDAAKQAEALRACLKSIERLLIAMDAANVAPFAPGQALAAHEAAKPAEPVAWRYKYKFHDIGETGAYEYHSHDFACVARLPKGEPLYAAPVAAASPLSDEQIKALDCVELHMPDLEEFEVFEPSVVAFARAIEAAHGIGASGEAKS